MASDDKLDAELRSLLAAVTGDEPVEVLVHPVPASAGDELERFLAGLAERGEVAYNPLPLHGSIAVRAPKRHVRELARRDDVARITRMPTFGL